MDILTSNKYSNSYQVQPVYKIARLPCANAPTGRPLHNNEWVDVYWVVDNAEDNLIISKVTRRRKRLLRLLQQAAEQGAAPTVIDLADALGVAQATIKRDLAALRQSGQQIHTRGSRQLPRREE